MSLTVIQTIQAHGAISKLIEEDKANSYVFPSAGRIKLAGNLRATRPIVEEYKAEHEALVRKLGAQKEEVIAVTEENHAAFIEEHTAMLDADTGVTLNPLTEKELGENQLPIDLLVLLMDTGVLK
jgi:hypothetical protein